MENTKSNKVLVIGGTGYLGKRMVMESLQQGYPTFVFMRPDTVSNIHKTQLLLSFKQAGAHLLMGSLEDHESLVNALKKVDVVISVIAENQLLQQLKVVSAIKEVGTIKRFLPSEFGMDVDKMEHAMKEANALFDQKRKVRRAIEEAGIPFTFVSANCLAGYFLSGLAQYGRFMPPLDKVFIYGDGNAKVVWVDEGDVAKYTMLAVGDERTVNKTMYISPVENTKSLMEAVGVWEALCGTVLEKLHVSEAEWLSKIEDELTPFQTKSEMAIFYHIFYKGELGDLTIDETYQCEATQLFPHVGYTSITKYLSQFI